MSDALPCVWTAQNHREGKGTYVLVSLLFVKGNKNCLSQQSNSHLPDPWLSNLCGPIGSQSIMESQMEEENVETNCMDCDMSGWPPLCHPEDPHSPLKHSIEIIVSGAVILLYGDGP